MQQLAWLVTLVGVLGLGSAFAFVALRSGTRDDAPGAARSAERLRAGLFGALLVAFVPITAASLTHSPHGSAAGDAIAVDAIGRQWHWELSRTRVPAGRLIVFRVTSADVNHGFAVYDPDLRVVGQTQAMPGYHNLLALRFDRPGTYRVLCLEYCGVVHHAMAAAIEVESGGF